MIQALNKHTNNCRDHMILSAILSLYETGKIAESVPWYREVIENKIQECSDELEALYG